MAAIPEPQDQRAAALSMFGDDTQPSALGEGGAMAAAGRALRPVSRRHLVAALLLALPFVGVAIWLDFLRVQINTFHFNDETIFHLGVIQAFAAQLPFPNLHDYNSATTPLFHLVFASAMRLFGLELPGLRLLNVLISYGVVLYTFHLFRRGLELPGRDALLATLAFAVSPYFFGAAFLALTDNLAWGLAVLTLGHALKAQRSDAPFDWVVASVLCGLTLLARQNYIWLYIALAGLAVAHPGALRDRIWRVGTVLASALPLVPLVLTWGGPVPPTFQAGGASGIAHQAGVHLNLLALNFLLAVLGGYSILFPPKSGPGLASAGADASPAPRCVPFAVPLSLAGTAVLLALWPMHRDLELHNGIVWTIAEPFPAVLGSSLFHWVLVPFGVHRLLYAARNWRGDLTNVGLLGVAFTALLSSAFIFQKYYDPVVPLLLVLATLRHGAPGRRERIMLGVLIGAGLIYFVAQSRLTVFG